MNSFFRLIVWISCVSIAVAIFSLILTVSSVPRPTMVVSSINYVHKYLLGGKFENVLSLFGLPISFKTDDTSRGKKNIIEMLETLESKSKLTPINFYTNGIHSASFPAKAAFDGDENTFWHSPQAVGTLGWLAVKLVQPAQLSGLTLTLRNDIDYAITQAPVKFVIEGSNNNRSWHSVAKVDDLGWEQKGEKMMLLFDNNSFKTKKYYLYYKFDFTMNRHVAYISVAEMELRGNISGTSKSELRETRERKKRINEVFKTKSILTPIAFYTSDIHATSFPAKAAFDGDENTFWHSSQVIDTLGWLAVKFIQPAQLSGLTLTLRNDIDDAFTQAPVEFVVEGSHDNENWNYVTKVGNFRWHRKGETKRIIIENGSDYLYYKLDFTMNKNTKQVSIAEIVLYSKQSEALK